jgi:hypothetical protein
MKHLFRIRVICSVLALVSAGALFASCMKKEGPARAVATFIVGTVTVEREGAPARPLRHKEALRPGDLVRTGAGSMLAIQLGTESVIRVDADTSLIVSSIMDEAGTRLNLERGRVLSRLRHLSKGTDFRISTKTAIAAVRGTEFSVTSGAQESVVAVNDGTVDVTKATGSAVGEKTVPVEVGKAAVVKDAVTTRPVTGDEKKEFGDFSNIKPVKDLDAASEADLKKLQDDYLKKTGGRDDSSSKDGLSGSDIAKNAVLRTGKAVYGRSETIVVYYTNMPEYRNCWIDVSRASDGDGRYQSYYWTYSAKNGKMEFAGLNLAPGAYEVRAHFGRGNNVDKRFRFLVR